MANVLGGQQGFQAKMHAGISSMTANIEATAATTAASAEAALVAFEAQYCTPATFLPSE